MKQVYFKLDESTTDFLVPLYESFFIKNKLNKTIGLIYVFKLFDESVFTLDGNVIVVSFFSEDNGNNFEYAGLDFNYKKEESNIDASQFLREFEVEEFDIEKIDFVARQTIYKDLYKDAEIFTTHNENYLYPPQMVYLLKNKYYCPLIFKK